MVSTATIPPAAYTAYKAYTLADGAIVAFNPEAKGCELPIGTQMTNAVLDGTSATANLSKCLGFIDVNGVTLPNKEVTCTEGNTATQNVQNSLCS